MKKIRIETTVLPSIVAKIVEQAKTEKRSPMSVVRNIIDSFYEDSKSKVLIKGSDLYTAIERATKLR